MQGCGKIAASFRKTFSLRYDCVGRFEKSLELGLEGVEVDASVVEPLRESDVRDGYLE